MQMYMRCKIWNDGNVNEHCAGWGFEIFLLQIDDNEIENKDDIKEKMSEYPEKLILLLPRKSAGKGRSKLYDAVEVNNKTESCPELRSKYIGEWLKDKGYIKDCRNPKDYVREAEFIFKLICQSKTKSIFELVKIEIKDKNDENNIIKKLMEKIYSKKISKTKKIRKINILYGIMEIMN